MNYWGEQHARRRNLKILVSCSIPLDTTHLLWVDATLRLCARCGVPDLLQGLPTDRACDRRGCDAVLPC